MNLLIYPNELLTQVCLPIEGVLVKADITKIRWMQSQLTILNAAGLAAPQFGWMVRLFVDRQGVYINPKFTWRHERRAYDRERCLSIPDVVRLVRRNVAVDMEYRDLQGVVRKARAIDMQARVWQHEVDHLDGKLIC